MNLSRNLFFLLIAAFSCASCFGSTNNSYSISLKKYESEIYFQYDSIGENEPFYLERFFKFEFPVSVNGSKDISSLQKKIISLIDNSITGTPDEMFNQVVEKANHLDGINVRKVDSIPEDKYYSNRRTHNTTMTFSKAIKNFVIFEYGNGAQWGMGNSVPTWVRYINFDLESNKEIKLCDIINKYDLNNIKRLIINECNNMGIGANLFDFETTAIEQFFLNEDSLTFYFDTYAIASGAVGPIEAKIPFSDLLPYMTDYGKAIVKEIQPNL